jgi:primosomal protein N' (replication factor Y)
MNTAKKKLNIAKVIVNLSLDKTFDYLIPDSLISSIHHGSQVVIPFGRSTRNGYVLNITDYSEYPLDKLKPISGLREKHPQINHSLIKLAEWMSEYYCCSKEQAVRALLPGAVRSGKLKKKTIATYYLKSTPEEAQEFLYKNEKKSPAKCAIIKVLLHHHGLTRDQLTKEAGTGPAPLTALVKSEIVEKQDKDVLRDPFSEISILPTQPSDPTPEQKTALETISKIINGKTKQHTQLLFGVTGSGKTEVYLQAIAEVLEQGKEAIVLVPEISLTPQTTRRFRARFGDMVSVLHSSLSDGERYDEWMKIHEGKVKIVVGARSALFAPFRKLGLIVVDEEHENSYKQSEAPRYHARDVAVMRGFIEKAAVILGSATPSLESFYNAKSGKYILSELTKRVDDFLMPEMKVVDMRDEAIETGHSQIFSRELVAQVFDRLKKGEQTIIFLNRRGFATQMICQQCGFVAKCADCSISYTYHQKRSCLTCHLCGAVYPAPDRCPECQAEDIKYSGLGTEKIEIFAKKIFKSASIRRMDSDTMTRKNSYEKTLGEFRSGQVDILIGTQMIAKGLHFPNVTLVGIIYADLSLHIPDFRAQERTFQLLTQVSGRAGRGEISGTVIVQTYTPFNPAIEYALHHDYNGFYEEEMEIREVLLYPPEGHLITVHFKGESEMAVSDFANRFAEALTPYIHEEITVSPPGPSPIARIKKNYRYMMVLRGKKMKELRAYLRHLALHSKLPKGVFLYVDADAVSMM